MRAARSRWTYCDKSRSQWLVLHLLRPPATWCRSCTISRTYTAYLSGGQVLHASAHLEGPAEKVGDRQGRACWLHSLVDVVGSRRPSADRSISPGLLGFGLILDKFDVWDIPQGILVLEQIVLQASKWTVLHDDAQFAYKQGVMEL